MNASTDGHSPPRRGEARRRVIEAGARVFAEFGFHAATKELIGDAAGYTHQTVRDHFRTKESLLAVIVADGWREVLAAMRGRTPIDELLAAFDALAEIARTHPAMARCMLHESRIARVGGDPVIVEEEQAFRLAIERIVTASTVSPDAVVRTVAILAALEGLVCPLVVPWFCAQFVYNVPEARRSFRALAEAMLA